MFRLPTKRALLLGLACAALATMLAVAPRTGGSSTTHTVVASTEVTALPTSVSPGESGPPEAPMQTATPSPTPTRHPSPTPTTEPSWDRVVVQMAPESVPLFEPLPAPPLALQESPSATATPVAQTQPVPTVVQTLVPTAVPVQTQPVPTVVPTAVPVQTQPVPTVVPAQTHVQRGQAALARVNYDLSSIGYTIAFHPGNRQFRGLTFTRSRTIEVYVRPGQSEAEVAYVIGHEIGHAIDHVRNDLDDRARWRSSRGIAAATPWWPNGVTSDLGSPAGDFAECFASWSVGSPSHSVWGSCQGSFALVAELAHN